MKLKSHLICLGLSTILPFIVGCIFILAGCERKVEQPAEKPQANFVRYYFGECEYVSPRHSTYDAPMVHAGDCSNPIHRLNCVPVDAGQKLDGASGSVPIYEGFFPIQIQLELGRRFLFTDSSEWHGVTFFDTRYVSVSKETMEKWVATAFKKIDKTYVAELHDCDDLAWEMLVFLRREAMHAHPQMEHGLLAGLAAVRLTRPIPELGTDFEGEHAVVLIRVKGGTWWVIEPSTGKGTKLDEELFDGRLELKGVWF